MNNLNEAWCHNWDKEKALYEENLQPLENAFKDALMKIPQDKRLQLGGMLIDDLWNDVYQKHFPYQKVTIGDDGKLPEINRSLLRHKRSRSGYYNSATGKPRVDEGIERLALLIHHNCVLKPKPYESAFEQALRTIMMRGSGIVDGSYNDWEYLENKQVEPVTYNNHAEPVSVLESPTRAPFFSKERWEKNKLRVLKYKKDSMLTTGLIGCVKGRAVISTELAEPKVKKTFVQKVKSFNLLTKIDFKNFNPKKWFKSRLDKFSKPISKAQSTSVSFKELHNQNREKIAIEFLKSARGQV